MNVAKFDESQIKDPMVLWRSEPEGVSWQKSKYQKVQKSKHLTWHVQNPKCSH